jgi:hypothetical protein
LVRFPNLMQILLTFPLLNCISISCKVSNIYIVKLHPIFHANSPNVYVVEFASPISCNSSNIYIVELQKGKRLLLDLICHSQTTKEDDDQNTILDFLRTNTTLSRDSMTKH